MHSSDPELPPLDFAGVSAAYGSGPAVLEGVTVRFPSRGVVQVAGANGSGKSTLIELASGYLAPLSGSVSVFGLPAASPEARLRRRVVRSRPALFPAMTVRDHLSLACLTSGGDRDLALGRAERYGLAPWWDSDAASLSAGNLRRLWIVMCTTGHFDLVLLDEPYLGLDAAAAAVLSGEITAWATEKLVGIVTHTPAPDVRVDACLSVSGGRVLQAAPEPVESLR